MQIHPYHYRLLYCLVCHKLKGDYRQPLTAHDKRTLITEHGIPVAENYIAKTLCSKPQPPQKLGQITLDKYAQYANYPDWNDFMRQNPVPEKEYYQLLKQKSVKLLEQLVKARMAELTNPQLKMKFDEG